jgi:hypothetical protein
MLTPVILYTSAGMPIGARAVIAFYRPTTTNDALGLPVANVIAAGSASTGVALGNFVIEDLTLDMTGTVVRREGTYGQDADAAVVRKNPTLNLTAQMAGAGSVTLCPGDYMEVNIGMTAASTVAAPASIPTTRWFLDGNSLSANQNQANKFALKLQLDRENSNASLKEF